MRLRYQSTTREYIEFLRDHAPDNPDPDIDNWGQIAYALWQANGGASPVDMAEASQVIADAMGGACSVDAGMPDGSAGLDAGVSTPPGGDDDAGGCGCRVVIGARARGERGARGGGAGGAGALALATAAALATTAARRARRRRRPRARGVRG